MRKLLSIFLTMLLISCASAGPVKRNVNKKENKSAIELRNKRMEKLCISRGGKYVNDVCTELGKVKKAKKKKKKS